MTFKSKCTSAPDGLDGEIVRSPEGGMAARAGSFDMGMGGRRGMMPGPPGGGRGGPGMGHPGGGRGGPPVDDSWGRPGRGMGPGKTLPGSPFEALIESLVSELKTLHISLHGSPKFEV